MVRGSADGRVGPGGGQGAAGHHQNNIQHQWEFKLLKDKVDLLCKFANIPVGWWVKVEGRSGLGFKHGIAPHPGIIDNGYRGDAGIKLYNNTDVDYNVKAGDRIAQFVLYPLAPDFVVTFGNSQESSRGDKGFGSSGK